MHDRAALPFTWLPTPPNCNLPVIRKGGTAGRRYTYVFNSLDCGFHDAAATNFVRHRRIGGCSQPTVSRALSGNPAVSADTRAPSHRRCGTAQLQGRQECVGAAPTAFAHACAAVFRGPDSRRNADQSVLSFDGRIDGPGVCAPRLRSADLVPAIVRRLARRL